MIDLQCGWRKASDRHLLSISGVVAETCCPFPDGTRVSVGSSFFFEEDQGEVVMSSLSLVNYTKGSII